MMMKIQRERPGVPGLVSFPWLAATAVTSLAALVPCPPVPPAYDMRDVDSRGLETPGVDTGFADVRASEIRQTVPRLESAAAQLAHAASLRTAMRGKAGEARESARKAAIEAYRAVREYFGSDTRVAAEAAFRAGELLRASDDAGGAISEFQFARERGADTPFRVRAALEIGHMHRRDRKHPEALTIYESVLADPGARPSQRDDASYWIGQVHAAEGRIEDARRAWQRVADGAEDPLGRIRAWDCIALSYVASGDLEAAAGVVERCREALSEVSAEETRLGERVRDALSTMRSLDDLQRAVRVREESKTKKEESASDASRNDAAKKKEGGSSFEPNP
jgi:tetratricopeptide (TPR) repeat protein